MATQKRIKRTRPAVEIGGSILRWSTFSGQRHGDMTGPEETEDMAVRSSRSLVKARVFARALGGKYV